MKRAVLVLATLGIAGCTLPNPFPQLERDGERIHTDVVVQEIPVVRDDSLVPQPEAGAIEVVAEPLRDIEGVTTGRAWLLELHRETMAQKEELERRTALQAARVEELERERDALAVERDGLRARTAELEGRVRAVEAQALELARRLAETEIARLEAEKTALELEARFERKERP
jgi:hypothetical protein